MSEATRHDDYRDMLAAYALDALVPSAPAPERAWQRIESEIRGREPQGLLERARNMALGQTPARRWVAVAAADGVAVSGSVTLFDPETPAGRIVLELADVPPSPAGHHYQVWVLRDEGAGAMEAIGVLSPDVAVDISVEEDGGRPEHSGASVAGASLSSAALAG
jgi:hypothetical protein